MKNIRKGTMSFILAFIIVIGASSCVVRPYNSRPYGPRYYHHHHYHQWDRNYGY